MLTLISWKQTNQGTAAMAFPGHEPSYTYHHNQGHQALFLQEP